MKNSGVISGEVVFIRTMLNDDGSTNASVSIAVSEETAKETIESLGIKTDMENIPVKQDESGNWIVKAHTNYAVGMFENSDKTNIEFSEVGIGSEVEIFVKKAEGRFKGKDYQTFYLKAMNVRKFVPYEEYNPFLN